MEFNYRYHGQSAVDSSANVTNMSFAPDTLRKPTFFSGKLHQSIRFREAISALHEVVISDLRFRPKDKTAYKEWAAQRELEELNELTKGKGSIEEKLQAVSAELADLNQRQLKIQGPFLKARQKYFNYIYKRDYNAWFVLDPVISVHPDEISFECFSKDESSYGRVSCNYEVFSDMGEFSCGTTNIDYSSQLYDEFSKIRDYKETRFEIDPGGFQVETEGSDVYNEVKIDLPDSWVRGFLQVSAAMNLPAAAVRLHPMDIHNFCFILRRHKERKGPRSMRFILKPGEPVTVIFEPWNITVTCARSVYTGSSEEEIRIWGRRRLHILERLIPVADGFTLYLAGSGMPSFYCAHLGDITFTLGLSGWTANDWSKAGNFDLMAPRGDVDDFSKQQVFNCLKENWVESADSLSKRLKVDKKRVLSSLFTYAQSGLVLYDMSKDLFRVRELSNTPLPLEKLRFTSAGEEVAQKLVNSGKVQIKVSRNDRENNLHLEGCVTEKSKSYSPKLMIDKDEALRRGTCNCRFYKQNKLYRGPCAHMLALRIRFKQKSGNWEFKLW